MNEYVYTPNTYYTNPYSVKSYSYVNETYPVYAYDTTPTYYHSRSNRVINCNSWSTPPRSSYHHHTSRSYICNTRYQEKKHKRKH